MWLQLLEHRISFLEKLIDNIYYSMVLVKKKIVQIFSDGSLNLHNSVIQKLKKSKIFNKDHTNFSFYKKSLKTKTKQKTSNNFKTKYFKF